MCLLLALSGPLPPTSGSVRRATANGRCDRHHAEILSSTSKIELMSSYAPRSVSYWACWRATGDWWHLGAVLRDARGLTKGHIEDLGYRGAWLVWAHYGAPDAKVDSMHSLNVHNGGRGPAVQVPRAALVRKHQGPISYSDPPEVAVTANGNYAWLVRFGDTPAGKEVDAIYTTDGKGGDRQLDIGQTGALDEFGAIGARKVTWTNQGRRHTVQLP